MNFDKTKAQAFTRGARWQRADQFNNLPVPSTGSLREIFALTPGEARLAQALARGTRLKQAARDFDVAHSTARKMLGSIFGKTFTNHQGHLVAILSRLAHIQPENTDS